MSAPLRGARSVVAAATTTALATAAHLAGGGAAPGAGLLAGSLILLALAAHVLADREHPLPALLAYVAASQAGLHLAFAGHHHHAGSGAPPGAGWDLAMLAAHALAGLLLAVWLRRGEAMLWAAARRLADTVLRVPVAAPTPPPTTRLPVAPTGGPVGVPTPALLLRAHPRRGPPAPVTVSPS